MSHVSEGATFVEQPTMYVSVAKQVTAGMGHSVTPARCAKTERVGFQILPPKTLMLPLLVIPHAQLDVMFAETLLLHVSIVSPATNGVALPASCAMIAPEKESIS